MMLSIMKFLTSELHKLTPRVYNEYASDDAIFPYVVFNVRASNITERNREDIVVEIDIWDYKKDGYDAIVNVELLTNEIDKFLRQVRYNGEDSLLIFQKINRLPIPDSDENVKRRQLRYVVKTYDKNQ